MNASHKDIGRILRLLLALAVFIGLALFHYNLLHPPPDTVAIGLRALAREMIPGLLGAIVGFLVVHYVLRGASHADSEKAEIAEAVAAHLAANSRNEIVTLASRTAVRTALAELLHDPKFYCFQGNTGSYFASVALPSLAATAHSQVVEITVQILEPCSTYIGDYARFRRKTEAQARADAIATMVLVCFWANVSPKLSIRALSLRTTFIQFRLDCSSSGAVVTSEGPDDPAILLQSTGRFYDKVVDHATLSFKQGRQLSTDAVKNLDLPPRPSMLELGHILDIVTALGINPDDLGDLDSVVAKVRDRDDPYA